MFERESFMRKLVTLGLVALLASISGAGIAHRAANDNQPTEEDVEQLLNRVFQGLKSRDKEVRLQSAKALEKAGWVLAGTWISVKNVLSDDPDAEVRHAAVRAVFQLGYAGALTTPVLIDALKDTDQRVREAAAGALGEIVFSAKGAVPALILLLKDDDHKVRYRAVAALGSFGCAAKTAVPALIEMLKDKRLGQKVDLPGAESLRGAAAICLARIGPDARTALPALLELVKGDEDWRLQANAMTALGTIGAEPEKVLPVLVEILKDQNRAELRGPAARALGEFRAKAKRYVPDLIKALDTTTVADRERATFIQDMVLDALGDIGPDAKEAIPQIEKITQDPATTGAVRHSANRALQKIRDS